jgi:hypothetical protein
MWRFIVAGSYDGDDCDRGRQVELSSAKIAKLATGRSITVFYGLS